MFPRPSLDKCVHEGVPGPLAHTAPLVAGRLAAAPAGFADFVVEDRRDALLDMVGVVRRKLLGVELAAGLGKLSLGDISVDEGKRLAPAGPLRVSCE